ncbi:Dyp-type peroxidase [Phytoactinopolyspora limicola]|uniref:Dyp-type peroxidase n=1 Tax=Phytoactinopolyspora limicola TaxID=2715536 RepID=UPI001A9CA2AF|nr:Dyp-type peroxidase [Phytoactinopolyspora limicola]
MSRPSRRRLLTGLAIGAGGMTAGGLIGGSVAGRGVEPAVAAQPAPAGGSPVPATGDHQAGIATPADPQPYSLTVVADVASPDVSTFAPVGDRLLEFLADASYDTGDLTVAVGVGPRVVAGIDGELPGAEPLPEFVSDAELATDRVGGDVLMIASASDPAVLPPAVDALLDALPGSTQRWRQFGFRGPGRDGIVRNPFGFHDGIIVPRGADELAEHVWLRDDPRVAGGTVAVVRRLRTDVAAFNRLAVDEQEAMVGRHKADGAPMSGGSLRDEVSLTAKTADGQYLTPLGSHSRSAHPALTGSALMLRRGYAYAEGDEVGLMFVCFQRDLRTFVVTQQRLDEQDRMMEYVTATASGTFLMLPGFDRDRPLGSTLLTPA